MDPTDPTPQADPAQPPPVDPLPIPAADPLAAPAKKPPSQGFLDSQRAMSLKWATKRGTYKDGKPVTDEDRAWYAAYEKAHPPKDASAKVRPPLGVVDGEQGDGEAPKAGPTPIAKAPPRVDPDPPRETSSAKAGKPPRADWRTKYRDSLKVTALAGIKVVGADGKPVDLDQREVVCLGVAGIVCGGLKWCEDSLALVGAKPYFGITTDTIAGSIVLMADEHLPKVLEAKPEHIVAFGLAAIVAPVAVNYKKIRAARAVQTDAQKHQAALAELKARTARAEAEYAAQQAQRASSPPPSSPPPAAPLEVVETKAGEHFRNPTEAATEAARAAYDPEREWKPSPESTLIV